MAYKLILLLAFTSLASHASEFVLSVSTNHDYTRLSGATSFNLFSDGKFVLQTNSGLNGICTADQVGQFVGQVSDEEVKQMSALLKDGFKTCKEINSNSCTQKDQTDNKSITWWASDLSGKKKETIYFKVDHLTDSSIVQLTRKIAALQKNATQGLALKKSREGVFVFEYSGTKHLHLPISTRNFFLVDNTGLVKPINELFPKVHFHQKELALKGGAKKKIKIPIKLPADAKNWRLLYDSSAGDNPVGHSDIQFTPCVWL